jgi:cobalt-precorrin 5A hydrolase / precorrin-3B C17-methyltransferase
MTGESRGTELRPVVAGIGCSSAVTCEEIVALVEAALATAGYAPDDLACLATVENRAEIEAVHAAARRFGRPLRCFTSAELGAESHRLATPSDRVADLAGLSGIAEAAALRAGSLLVPKQKSAHATCALGLAPAPFDVASFGREAGR